MKISKYVQVILIALVLINIQLPTLYQPEFKVRNKTVKIKPEAKGYGIWDNFHLYLGIKFIF